MTALTTDTHDRDPLAAAVLAALRDLPVQRGAAGAAARLAALDKSADGAATALAATARKGQAPAR